MPRNNIQLRRLPAPKRLQLPNVRVFFAKYQRVGRDRLPERVRIRRAYVRKIGSRRQRIRKIGPRNQRTKRQQVGRDLDLSTAIDLGKRAVGSRLGKIMINGAINYIPTAYKKMKNKIKNKNVKAVVDIGIDDYVVNKGIELIGERFN